MEEKNKISAKILADSKSPQGSRLTSFLVTFPRFILAELNTHRMLSKNSASSRAIPTHKLLKMIQENPFIPIAWQKEHKGMQGTEYFTEELYINTQVDNWLKARDSAVKQATYLIESGVTKQIANRLLEPFMWHTVLISGTEWENFFELRCPQYEFTDNLNRKTYYRSRKDVLKDIDGLPIYELGEETNDVVGKDTFSETDWLKLNKGQAEIHMMALAEAIWDAMNESKPRQLEAGEWHIPFEDKITENWLDFEHSLYKGEKISWAPEGQKATYNEHAVKISTAMAARTSYTVVGDEKEVSYETLLGIHDKMAVQVPFHASPFEHCARAMDDKEHYNFVRGEGYNDYGGMFSSDQTFNDADRGWCRNYRGFIQYRHILENENSTRR